MTIKAREMHEVANYWTNLMELRDKVLVHAKSYAKKGEYRSSSFLHTDEYSFLFRANLNDFEQLFTDLGYVAYIERYDEIRDGYLGEARLYWDEVK